MASIRKRGARWRVQVAKLGQRLSSTHASKARALAWAAEIETAIAAGRYRDVPDKSFGDLLARYAQTVSPRKRGCRWEVVRIDKLRRDRLAAVRLVDLAAPHFADWRDRRLGEVSAAAVRREWTLLSHACTIAAREWQWLTAHPMHGVRRPAATRPRTRRISDDELRRLVLCAGYDPDRRPDTATARVGAALLFAVETALRAGEIGNLTWTQVDTARRAIHIPHTKNGHPRDVPLSRAAVAIIERVRGLDPIHVFGLRPQQIDRLFRKIKARALLTDLHFHDARREALTRLALKLDVLALAKMSGHRDLRILLDVYYAPTTASLADRIDAP